MSVNIISILYMLIYVASVALSLSLSEPRLICIRWPQALPIGAGREKEGESPIRSEGKPQAMPRWQDALGLPGHT